MVFKVSKDGTLGSAKAVATGIGTPYMYGTGDVTTLPSNEIKITASDAASGDAFGTSVAVGSGRVVVGAYANDDAISNSGSAYIYDFDGTELAKITASDAAQNDQFGISVAVGNRKIVVGANRESSDTGAAYIFDLDGTELSKITASDGATSDNFGYSVAVGNGRIVVGAWGDDDDGSVSGSAYIFDLDGTQLAKITASDAAAGDFFGWSVAVGNGKIVVGAYLDDPSFTGTSPSQGSAYIFDLDGNELAKITASDGAAGDQFGVSVAVGSGRIVVGAFGDDSSRGSAYIFDLNGNQLKKIIASDRASSDYFGESVGVGSGRVVVGAYGDDDGPGDRSGSVYIFDLEGNQLGKINASDATTTAFFGRFLAVGPGKIVVGAEGEDTGAFNAGAAYIFDTPSVITPYDLKDWEYG